MQGQPLQIVVLSAIVTAALACAPDDQRPPAILQERASSVSLMVKSASSDAALASADVEIVERVICKRDPCPPVVTWKGRTDRRGVVRVPTSHLHDEMMLRVPGYGSRELAVSEFHPDNQAWTLYLAPDGPIACGTSADQWTIRVARDWRSAEVRNHDRAIEFGILR